MEILQCYLLANECYMKSATMKPQGIVVHSTGVNNPNLKRYVQPLEHQQIGVTQSAEHMLSLLGKNLYNNDWNHFYADNQSGRKACVHAFIGKLADGTIDVVQTLPFIKKSWGCGSGSKGSYNDTHIQFEICEDDLKSKEYFQTAMNKAIEFCAFLCKTFGISVDKVVSHHEAHEQGFASNHSDIDHWLTKYGQTMDEFRNKVSEKTKENTQTKNTAGQDINARIEALEKLIQPCVTKYNSVNDIPAYAAGTIQKLISKNYLHGDNGELKLSDQMIRMLVILDRAGLFE